MKPPPWNPPPPPPWKPPPPPWKAAAASTAMEAAGGKCRLRQAKSEQEKGKGNKASKEGAKGHRRLPVAASGKAASETPSGALALNGQLIVRGSPGRKKDVPWHGGGTEGSFYIVMATARRSPGGRVAQPSSLGFRFRCRRTEGPHRPRISWRKRSRSSGVMRLPSFRYPAADIPPPAIGTPPDPLPKRMRHRASNADGLPEGDQCQPKSRRQQPVPEMQHDFDRQQK